MEYRIIGFQYLKTDADYLLSTHVSFERQLPAPQSWFLEVLIFNATSPALEIFKIFVCLFCFLLAIRSFTSLYFGMATFLFKIFFPIPN